jgi:riboflavin synthase
MVSIYLIQEKETILLKKKAGETVNLECDVFGKLCGTVCFLSLRKKQVPQRGLAKNFYKKTDFFKGGRQDEF